jgi:hypothetical protein
MLTGIYLIKDASYYTVTSKQSTTGAEAKIPIPEPTGLAELLDLKVNMHVKLSSGSMVTAGGQILGEKVWAAQWQQVDANTIVAKDWEGKAPNRLKLLGVRSKAVRGGYVAADLSIGERKNLVDEEPNKSVGEDTEAWKEFEKEVREFEAMLASEDLED